MVKLATVVICTWNRAGLLRQTLETLRRLRIPEGISWELLVVNNNCTDETDEVVGQYADRLPLVLCHEPRPGKSNACNHAIARARGEVILWTDDDVVVDPSWMTETLKAFEDHEAHLVFGKVLPWWETAPPPWYSAQFDGLFALLDYGPAPFVVTDRHQHPYGVNMAMRREVFRDVGGFAQEGGTLGKSIGWEDLEIFRRVMERGMRVAYTPNAVIHHFIPRARCTKAYYRSRVWHGSCNHLRMLREDAAETKWLLGLPRYYYRMSLGHLGSCLASTCHGNKSAAFYYELKVIRFVGLLREALQSRKRDSLISASVAANGGLASSDAKMRYKLGHQHVSGRQ